jgi:hypothetical protein
MNINLPASACPVNLSEVKQTKDARVRMGDRSNNLFLDLSP